MLLLFDPYCDDLGVSTMRGKYKINHTHTLTRNTHMHTYGALPRVWGVNLFKGLLIAVINLLFLIFVA